MLSILFLEAQSLFTEENETNVDRCLRGLWNERGGGDFAASYFYNTEILFPDLWLGLMYPLYVTYMQT